MLKRIYIGVLVLMSPYVMRADPLDGLPALFSFYGAICLIAGVIGILIPIVIKLRRALVLIWSVLCLLVSFLALDPRDDWSLELWCFGPGFCFAVGVGLFLAFFLNLLIRKLKSRHDGKIGD